MARRLPVYLLIDTSGSMQGEPIESVKVGLDALLSSLRSDPFALESVYLSLYTFDKDVKCLAPLTPVDEFYLPEITTPDSGPTHMGAVLEYLVQSINREVIKNSTEQKGDWLPIVVLMTDGKPSDTYLFNEMVKKINSMKFGRFVACAAGPKSKVEPLKLLTNDVYRLENMDSSSFSQFFEWVSSSIGVNTKSQGIGDATDLDLPPPPDEITIV
jgi:uncharacterized protein YegL